MNHFIFLRRGLFLLGVIFALAWPVPVRAQAVATIGDFVWRDHNRDGIQDAGEQGLGGVTVQLWSGDKTTLLGSTVSVANGAYSFTIAPGVSFRLRALLPSASHEFSPWAAGPDVGAISFIFPDGPHAGYSDVYSMPAGIPGVANLDIGIIANYPVNIGNRVWCDTGRDGRQDPDELGFPGVTVQLWNEAKTEMLDADVTDEYGLYTVTAPKYGRYRVRVMPPSPAYLFTVKKAGDNLGDSDFNPAGPDQGFSDVLDLSPQLISIITIDAGLLPVETIPLGNFVWHDEDADGLQDAGEPGVPNVVVELWNASRTRRWTSAATNSNGLYTLIAPGPGEYRIWVLRPLPTDEFAPANVGSNNALDSDILGGANDGFSLPFTVGFTTPFIGHLDAGLILPSGRRLITPLRLTSFNLTSPNPSLTFTGPVGGIYHIERDTGVDSFSVFITLISTQTPTTVSLPPSALAGPQRFFRVRRVK